MITKSQIRKLIISFIVSLVILDLLFAYIFPGHIILKQFVSIFGIKIYYYGVILALGVATAYYFATKRLPLFNFSRENFDNIVFVLILSGFFGARLYHVLSSFSYYQLHLSEVLYVWNGGLSIFGAIIAGFVGVYIYHRYYLDQTISLYKLLDFLAPSVVIGQAIGRFGNLFNYEAYGKPTEGIIKMFVPVEFRIPPYETFSFYHPLFLYEAIAGLLILLFLLKWVDIAQYLKINLKSGQVFLLWLGLYNIVRFGTETLRLDSPYLFGVKQNLLTSIVLVLVSAGLFIKLTYFSNESE